MSAHERSSSSCTRSKPWTVTFSLWIAPLRSTSPSELPCSTPCAPNTRNEDYGLFAETHLPTRRWARNLRSAAISDFSFSGSSLDAGCARGWSPSSSGTALRSRHTWGLSRSSSSSSRVRAGYADFCSDRAKSNMFLRASRSLTRHGLVRKTRQVQHNTSHCGVLSWRGVQAKSWKWNFLFFWIQFNSRTQILHLREGE